MKPNLNLKSSQGHNVESNKPLNQSFQGGLEKISYINSNGPPGNYCKVPNKHLIVERLLNLWSKLLYNGLWYLDYIVFALIFDILPFFQAHWLNNEIRLYLDLKSFCFSFDFSLGILFFVFSSFQWFGMSFWLILKSNLRSIKCLFICQSDFP